MPQHTALLLMSPGVPAASLATASATHRWTGGHQIDAYMLFARHEQHNNAMNCVKGPVRVYLDLDIFHHVIPGYPYLFLLMCRINTWLNDESQKQAIHRCITTGNCETVCCGTSRSTMVWASFYQCWHRYCSSLAVMLILHSDDATLHEQTSWVLYVVPCGV